MVSALLTAMVAVLVVVACLLVLVLVLLCRLLALWGAAGAPAPRSRAARTPAAERRFTGGRDAVDAVTRSTTRVMGR